MAEETTSAAPKKNDFGTRLIALPTAEKMLGTAAVAVLVAFVIRHLWAQFDDSWFYSLALIGSVGVVALIVMDLATVKFMDAIPRTKIMILLAILPAIGFVLQAFRSPGEAVMLAGAIVMGYAAAKITTREKIIRDK